MVKRSLIALDGLIVSCSFLLSYLLRQNVHLFYKLDLIPAAKVISEADVPLSVYLLILFFVTPFWCLMLYFNGMYRSMRTRTFFEICWIIIRSSFFSLLGLGTAVFLFKLEFMSRMFFAIFAVVCFGLILLEKSIIYSIMHYLRRRGFNYRRLLIVGTGRRAANLTKMIRAHPEWGFDLLGVIDDEPGRGATEVANIEVLGTLKDIPELSHQRAVDEVIYVVPRSRLSHIENSIRDCEILGVRATVAVDLYDLRIAKSRQKELEGIPFVSFETTVAREWPLFVKRIMDVVISGLIIIVWSPLLLAISVIIKLSSSGPVLFKQERIGLNARKFMMYKFRTMYRGSQEKLSGVDIFEEIYSPQYKNKKIQCITPIGKILRKLSLDEIPQLFNVFWGHMSLVGPRPTLPQEVVQYEAWHRRRFSMRPGITCLWQVKGRRKIKFNEWMKLDLEYLDNWSLWLDIKILIRTVPAILFGAGAY